MAKQNPSTTYEITEPGEWSAPKLVAIGALFLAAFFVFIYNVSP
jgi:hypothetical protein